MNKAFIFDMDGVIIDDESIWEEAKKGLYKEVLGKEVNERLGPTLGINMDDIYKRAVQVGSTVSKEKLLEAFYNKATDIYHTAPITPGIEQLADTLHALGYKIGIVSSSPNEWIDIVVKRLSFQDKINIILSLFDRPDLQHKPAPDGYLEAMKELHSSPELTVVLEDSNPGIESAKAAKAYTIGLKQNVVTGYVQVGADEYAKTMDEVVELVRKFEKKIKEPL